MGGLEARGIVGPFALKGVDLLLRPGEWLALLGPNGSGKTTLLRVMAGLLRPRRGEVLLEGRPLRAYGSYERGRLLAYLPQNGPYPEGLLVEEVVRLGRLPHLGLWGREGREDREAVDWALEVTGASAFRGRLLGTLSGGERQRVLLARALAGRPRYLLLDEPTTFLDLAHQGVVVGLLRRLAGMGLGVLSVLHDPNQAALAHRVAVLEGGRVVAEGRPEAVLQEPLLARLYGAGVRVVRLGGGPMSTWTRKARLFVRRRAFLLDLGEEVLFYTEGAAAGPLPPGGAGLPARVAEAWPPQGGRPPLPPGGGPPGL